MRVEVIHHHINAVGIGIQDVNRITHCISEMLFGSTGSHQHMPSPCFGFDQHEQVASAVAFVFVVLSIAVARFHGYRFPQIAQQLNAFFVKTDHRTLGGKRLLIQRQNVFHAFQKQGRDAWNTPTFHSPRFKDVFFNTVRIVVSDTVSTIASSISCWADNSAVQRFWPAGGVLHANAIRYASCRIMEALLRPLLTIARQRRHSLGARSITCFFSMPAIMLSPHIFINLRY